MPDTSAVTLPQWDKTLLGKGNLKAGMESLGSVIKKASAVKNRLNAIKVLILKAGEKQLQWRVHTTTSGYDTYSSYLESEITPSGLDIVIVNDDVPRAVLSDPAVQAEAQQVELLLHRMIVRFAAMEKSGKVVPEKAYDQLAALLNKYQLWALLINEYELRGVSAPTYAALMDRFRSDPELLESLTRLPDATLSYSIAKEIGKGKADSVIVSRCQDRRHANCSEHPQRHPEDGTCTLARENTGRVGRLGAGYSER